MDSATDLTTLLNRLQDQIKTGQVVLVLGPNTGSDARTVSGTPVLSQSQFVDAVRREFALTDEDGEALTLDQILDYCLSIPDGKEQLVTLIRAGFICRVPGSLHRIVPNFVWHRIYSFDISDALELAYRQNLHRSQSLIRWVLGDPITPPRELSDRVELIKLYGDAKDPNRENFLTTPGYLNRSARSRWYDQMLNDLETHPTVFLGEDGDLTHLIGAFRRITHSTGSAYLVASQIGGLQARTVLNLPIQHLAISPSEFFAAVHAAMPGGRDIGGILSDTAAMPISSDPRLAATLLNDFDILTGEQLRRLSAAHTEPRGGIRRFYRGEDVRWSDISENIIADITPYKNFRGRINNELNKGFPGGTLFVLLSPAGMGKTVGLMSTAYWLRQQVNLPLLWFRSEGDLGSFFHRVQDTDFDQGAFIIIDDIAIYTADLEDVRPQVLRKFCFIATSRETRWLRYGPRIKGKVDRVIEEQNSTD